MTENPRSTARAAGLKQYIGAPCKKHGDVYRWVSSGGCTACGRESSRKSMEKRRRENPEEIREINRRWSESNPEKVKECNAIQYEKNKPRRLAYAAQYRRDNPERCKESVVRWVKANPERVRELNRKHYHKDLRKSRRSKVIAAEKRRAKLSGAGGFFDNSDIDFIRDSQRGLCAYCEADLSEHGEHIDHVIPIARGGTNWPVNLQLTCPTCNARKRDKCPVEFEIQMIREGIAPWLDRIPATAADLLRAA